jgi:ethanolamine utilization protein EutN
MRVARVVGTVVGSVKHPQMHGRRLLVLQPLELGELSGGDPLIAVDVTGVGVGEEVLFVDDGAAARTILGSVGPVRSVVVGVVDETKLEGAERV